MDVYRGSGRVRGGTGDAVDAPRSQCRAVSGARNVSGYLAGYRVLLLDCRSDRVGELGDVVHRCGDRPDGVRRLVRCGLYAADVTRDFVGCLGRLTCERLDL